MNISIAVAFWFACADAGVGVGVGVGAGVDVSVDVIVPVSVEGEVAIYADREQMVRDAKRDARRKAVESGAGPLEQRHVILRNYRVMADELATTAKGLIVDEQWSDLRPNATGSTATISLQAKVNRSAMARAVCTVVRANHDPKVAFVVVERVGDPAAGARWSNEGVTHTALAAAFNDACFTVVDRVRLMELSAQGDAPQEELDRIIKESNAQYVILAAAEASPVAEQAGTWRTVLRVKMVNTSTNEIEAVSLKARSLAAASAADALTSALTSARSAGPSMVGGVVDELTKKVVLRWEEGPTYSPKTSVIVKGAGRLADATAFKKAVEKLLPTGSTVELRVAKGGQASFDIRVDGGSEWFANAVEGKPVGKKFIEVVEVSRGKVILTLSDVPYTPK